MAGRRADGRTVAALAHPVQHDRGVAAPGRDLRGIGHQQHLGGIRAPGQRVGFDPPIVRHQPDRGQNTARISRRYRTGTRAAVVARHGKFLFWEAPTLFGRWISA